MTVIIAGAGIAGLTLGLTLHQIGIPFRIFEAVDEIKPLGVGINLQPNAVRELFELGLEKELAACGIRTQEYGFFTKTGKEIWTEPRGLAAGYKWPQYSVHRGRLQMALLAALQARAGKAVVETSCRATGVDQTDTQATVHFDGRDNVTGDLVIAADGINSAIRAQFYPQEGQPIWNGAVLWRATSLIKPFRTAASMILAGHDTLRIVAYPIAEPDPKTGLQEINWIAEKRTDPKGGWSPADYNRSVDITSFLTAFENWTFDWLNCPDLIQAAECVYEYPMIDRDPLPRWRHGRVTLMGDAAHPAYPVGSNGASQAIIDARLIGAGLQQHGLKPEALDRYEEIVRPQMANVVNANRSGGGPDGVMQMVEDLCGGEFNHINDVIPHAELAAHAEKYKSIAGFSIDELNARAPLISM